MSSKLAGLVRVGEAKITRGGQVTLSKRVREEMGVEEGDYVIFYRDDRKVVILPAELKPKE